MHAGVDIGLGNNQQPRGSFRNAMISGVISRSSLAALEHPQLARAHDAERAVKIRFEHLPVDAVVSHAEECEIVGEEPLQELNALPAISSTGNGGGLLFELRSMMPSTRSRIARQSCTATRTSPSTISQCAHELFACGVSSTIEARWI